MLLGCSILGAWGRGSAAVIQVGGQGSRGLIGYPDLGCFLPGGVRGRPEHGGVCGGGTARV